MKIDLHIHTTASDGTWTPEALLTNIKRSGIQIFSVTDHDSVNSISKAAGLAKDAGLRFIPGVEINTSFKQKNYHVLGYGIDINHKTITDIISANRKTMEKRDEESILYLAQKGYPVSIEEFHRYNNDPERGGWKALNYVIDKELCSYYRDFFTLLGDRADYFFAASDYTSTENAIASVKKAGGIPVLAHPGARLYGGDYRNITTAVFELGIKGIECYHPENDPEVTNFCLEFCKKNDLYITGGSDCHGAFVKERMLGKPDIDLNMLDIRDMIK